VCFRGNYYEERFLASLGQLAGRGRHRGSGRGCVPIKGRWLPPPSGSAPSPWIVGVTALLVVVLVSRWSRQTGWDDQHRLALAGGALPTYVWASFPVPPEGGGSATVDLASNIVSAPWPCSSWRWPSAGEWAGP
jgi:hypothetical protein